MFISNDSRWGNETAKFETLDEARALILECWGDDMRATETEIEGGLTLAEQIQGMLDTLTNEE